MPALHVIVREQDGISKLPSGLYESGYWIVDKNRAERLKDDGDLFIHAAQDKPSHHGGKIRDFRVHNEAESPVNGKIVFTYEPTPGHRGVASPAEGWAHEKCYVGF